MHSDIYDLIGVGIGPFNLSLAALLGPLDRPLIKFYDNKKSFDWHPELLLDNAPMQTSFLKDLVTPVQPTNPYSYLNYLVSCGQFYHFLNTGRDVITRLEFNHYLKWCSEQLSDLLEFDSPVLDVKYQDGLFKVIKSSGETFTRNLCVASGPVPFIPECSKPFIGESVFHAKSKHLKGVSLQNKKVLVVGGGQTGLEVFRNVLNEKWGKSQNVTLITGRDNLLPLDEGPFTNEIFTPQFVSEFYELNQDSKDKFTKSLLLTSDGNTPSYLADFYNELYLDKFYKKSFSDYTISPKRWLETISKKNNEYEVTIRNTLSDQCHSFNVDVIILATGFTSGLPNYLDSLKEDVLFDDRGRLCISRDYKLRTKFKENNIYMMNYSRHGHGIADPQTSLMSWRSAVIANDLLGESKFKNTNNQSSFIDYFTEGRM